jgi:hypothetical protein
MRNIIRTSTKVLLTVTAAAALFVAGVGAFVLAIGLSEAYADEMVIEKRVEERVVEPAPAVIEKKVVEEKVEAVVPPPVVTKERTTVVEKVPPPAVIEKRVEEHVIEDD